MGEDKSKMLVVGSNGYIGSHLAKRLIDSNYNVVLTDIGAASIIDHESYVQLDFSKSDRIADLIEDVDYVFFFAGKTGDSSEGFDKANEFILGNEITLVNLLNAARKVENAPKIIFPSTRLLYAGNNQAEIVEDAELAPKSVYAINKLACENFVKLYHHNFGIDYSIFRISLPYGGFVEQDHVSYGVMSYLLNKAKNGESLKVYGDGKQKGSLIHIHDLVEMLIKGSLHPQTSNQTFNIGGPDSLPIGEVVQSIAELCNVPVDNVPWPEISKNTDQGNLVINSNKLRNLIDYEYKFTFEEWLRTTKL